MLCPYCRERFAALYAGADLLTERDPARLRHFQAQTVIGYTAALCRGVKALDPLLQTITCIMPHDRACFEGVAAIPELDVLGTDPYWLLPGSTMTIEQAVADAELIQRTCAVGGKASQIWLNAWKIPAGREGEVYTGGLRLAAVGCDALYTWSYRGGLGT